VSAEATRPEHVEFDDSPARLTAVLSVIAAAVAVGATGVVSLLALLFGALGWVLIVAGLFARGSRTLVSIGTGGVFLCFLVGSYIGAPMELQIVSMLAMVVAWDAGHHSIVIGRQLGRDAPTRRPELVHVAVTVGIGVAAAAVGYAVFLTSGGQVPFAGVFLMLVAVIVFAWSIRA